MLYSAAGLRHIGTADVDVQVRLEITGGPEQASRLELALRNADFSPESRSRILRASSYKLVLPLCYARSVHAGDESYDGVPYADLAFTEVDWSEAIDHIRHRGQRQGQPAEFDLEPEWASEALADPRRARSAPRAAAPDSP